MRVKETEEREKTNDCADILKEFVRRRWLQHMRPELPGPKK
jgi:hypothetical protein